MEIRTYINILWKERATIVLSTIVTLIAAYVFTLNQPVIYEATATFVMRPRAAWLQDQGDLVDVFNTLGRQASIGATYVEVASSRLIRQQAGDTLDLTSEERRGLKVSGHALAGTNILELSVQGPDPDILHTYTNQIGAETLAYVSNLYEIFELEPLDAATRPRNPIQPTSTLNLVLGGVLGVILGTGIALLSNYLRTPQAKVNHFDVIDPETGLYSVAYLRLRMGEEISRSRRKGETFSMALIQISRGYTTAGTDMVLRAAAYLQAELRDEDLLAYAGEGTFAILLVDMPGEEAKKQVELLCSRLRVDVLMEAKGTKLWGAKYSAGVSSFKDAMASGDDMWNQAVHALTDINKNRHGQVNLYTAPEGVLASTHPAQ